MSELKILIVGNVGAGKTSLIQRYIGNDFMDCYKATIGVDFQVKGRLTLWDIAGQERFGSMTSVYYRGADGALVVIDWTNRDSIDIAEKWIKDLKSKLDIPILLIANKCDKPSVVNFEDVDSIKGVIGWKTTSAKTGQGIEEAMNVLVDAIGKTIKLKRQEDLIKIQKLEDSETFCC